MRLNLNDLEQERCGFCVVLVAAMFGGSGGSNNPNQWNLEYIVKL